MKKLVLISILCFICIPGFSQQDSSDVIADSSGWAELYKQSHEKALNEPRRKLGVSAFAGMGSGGNQIAHGYSLGGSARVHYKIHTWNIFYATANILAYHGGQSDNSRLSASYSGLTYGIGLHDKNISASVGGGIGYSAVNMSTGGGASYKSYWYANPGLCLGGQFSYHGEFFGVGTQVYYNITSPHPNYVILFGVEFHFY